jgi:preprotein translocase SecE subunit
VNKLVGFFKDSWLELKQVSWLTVPQMIASTWLCVILVIVMAIFVYAIDKVLQILFRFVV